jgi:hypothetical protein
MYTLRQALGDHHLIVLRVIGEWWEQDLTGMEKGAAISVLVDVLPQIDLAHELLYMPVEEAAALRTVAAAAGKLSVAALSREFGTIRPMGPGKLEREEPWLMPESAVEGLWYRGLLYTGFDNSAEDVTEYYFIPPELLANLPAAVAEELDDSAENGIDSPASRVVAEPDRYTTAPSNLIDDLTTLLCEAQRGTYDPSQREVLLPLLHDDNATRYSLLVTLADELNFFRQREGVLRPTRAAVAWLRLTRESQLRALLEAWSSSDWNELRHVPGLVCEGSGWDNDPILARTQLLTNFARDLQWEESGALIAAIKADEPDFQRPNGDYDTWYVRDASSSLYLRGFDSWDQVEGRQLQFIIERVMWWLGMTDVGGNAVRLNQIALNWLEQHPEPADEVRVPLVVNADASIAVPHNAGRWDRFRVSRIADPLPVVAGKPYQYILTPESLARAAEQGIDAQRVLTFLADVSNRPIPAGTKRAIERWGERGVEARLESVVILRVNDAAVLDTLRSNPRTKPYIGAALGDLAVIVRHSDWQKLRQITAQLGLLLSSVDTTESL